MPATSFRASRLNATSKQLLEFYPEPNTGSGGLDQQLSRAPGSRDQQVPVHAADGPGAELRIILDGPLQLRQRERGVAGAEAERHEARHAGSSGRARQHLDGVVDPRQRIPVRLQLLLQHVRAGAGVRARRRQGAEHPGHLAESSRSLGDPVDRHHRVQRLRRQHRRAVHEPQQGVRVQRQRVVDSRAAFVQVRRRRPVRHVQPGGQPVRARQFPVSAHRHRLRVRRLHAWLHAADRIRRRARGDEVPRRSATRTTSPTRGRSART